MRTELQNLPEPQWFHHGEYVLSLLDWHKPRVCVELGTNTGGSAIAVARLIRKWGGILFCIDKWDGSVSYKECALNLEQAEISNVILVQDDTVHAARNWRQAIDYLYVDADHSYAGCKLDLDLWWSFLRPGGLIAGDDYDDPHGIPSQGVTAAWDAFEREHDQKFIRIASENLIGCQCELCRAGRLIWGDRKSVV